MSSRKIETDGPPNIELFRTQEYYIFLKNEYSLWWNRATGVFEAKTGWDLAAAVDPECLGVFYGIIGKIEIDSVIDPRLMLIREYGHVGDFIDGHPVYKIKSVAFLQLGDTDNLNLTLCKKHQHSSSRKGGFFDQKSTFAKTIGAVKSATNSIKNSTQQAAALAIPQVKFKFISKDKEKFEKRILDELNKIFTDTDSFYFSLTCDLTNTLQRQCKRDSNKETESYLSSIDDRFFWNKFMVQDLDINNPAFVPWILPIVQGFIQIESCKIEVGCDFIGNEALIPKHESFKLILISRRSRHRAGTRYKRRGVDEDGHCANYVETEQILQYHHHRVSFVQTRGSVPVFWSQPGYKYRPPPRIDKGPAETQVVFERHFQHEFDLYGPVCVVNLVEQGGKEKIIWDSYTNHILAYNEPNLTYATFDFHEYCRGMHFENVSYLIASLADVVRSMGYCWTDKEGTICYQMGVFRVNCIDCLDRTNVVQTALAKSVMEIQLTKLGLIVPDCQMPQNVRSTFQLLWANNGDIISKQYAGTNALKGDYTRTGERKFTGLMKDGMNSANRYCRVHFLDSYRQAALDLTQGKELETIDLLNQLTNDIALASDEIISIASAIIPKHPPEVVKTIALAPEFEFFNAVFQVSRYYLSRFKDAYRQASIDMMLGNDITEDVFNTDQKQDEEDSSATAEHVKLLIEDCKKLLINDLDLILGSWGLIDADPVTGDPTETEMDTILILTKDSYYMAEYDEQIDRVTKYQKVDLKDVRMIELGPIPNATQVSSMFKFNKNVSSNHCIRIHYSVAGEDGYFHMFRSMNLRFFNNLTVVIKTQEEMQESLKAICETFTVAFEIAQLPPITYIQGRPLDRKKSKVLDSAASCRLGSYLDLGLTQGLTRNVSETQLVALKSAGTKALTNITQQFSKINKLGQSLRRNQHQRINTNQTKDRPSAPVFSVEPIEDKSEHSNNSRRSSNESEESVDLELRKINPNLRRKHIHYPNVGILMNNESQRKKITFSENFAPFIDTFSVLKVVESDTVSVRHKNPLLHSKTDLSFDVEKLNKSMKNYKESLQASKDAATPKTSKLTPPNSLQINRQLSHSANEIEEEGKNQKKETAPSLTLTLDKRCSSEKDLTLNMVSSQSENALRSLKLNITNVITSPAMATKDMLSPFSKIAKGVHNLGANLDPRKLKGIHSVEPSYKMSEAHLEEIKRLEERWKSSRTKLIAL